MSQFNKVGIAVVIAVAIGLSACSSEKEEIKLTPQQKTEMTERLAPVGKVVLEKDVGSAPVAAASAEPRSGEDVYNSKCTICHGSGAGGAPKTDVADQWTARIEQGIETLYTHAIKGVRAMPAKGLCMDCSDDEVKAAVDYILAQH